MPDFLIDPTKSRVTPMIANATPNKDGCYLVVFYLPDVKREKNFSGYEYPHISVYTKRVKEKMHSTGGSRFDMDITEFHWSKNESCKFFWQVAQDASRNIIVTQVQRGAESSYLGDMESATEARDFFTGVLKDAALFKPKS